MEQATTRTDVLKLIQQFIVERKELGDSFWPRHEAFEPVREVSSGSVSPVNATLPPVTAERFRIPQRDSAAPVPDAEPKYHVASSGSQTGHESLLSEASMPSTQAQGSWEGLSLDDFRKRICDCRKCPLGATRTNFVFGSGNPEADLMFIGEAPGEDEDRQGQPFVGRAGQLLTKMIEAMQMSRNEVYIANVLKCRPPSNRTPLPSEMEQCQPYLDHQIELVHPKIICALGRVAAQALLNTGEGLGRMRGTLQTYKGIKVLVTYHPAALLRNPAWKIQSWDDLQKLRYELDGTVLRPKKA